MIKITIDLTPVESLLVLDEISQYISKAENEVDKQIAERVRDKIRESASKAFEEKE